jgi:threonine dehydrogenase-like Zn-dependent dehydrogenase
MVCFSGKHVTYSKVKASFVGPLPHGTDPQVAAFHSIVGHAMTGPRLAPPRFGENVVVVGLGLIGNLTAQLFRLAGAGVVAGADLYEFRLRKAREAGAIDAAFNVGERALSDWVDDLGPYGAELIVDAVGASNSRRTSESANSRRNGEAFRSSLWIESHKNARWAVGKTIRGAISLSSGDKAVVPGDTSGRAQA